MKVYIRHDTIQNVNFLSRDSDKLRIRHLDYSLGQYYNWGAELVEVRPKQAKKHALEERGIFMPNKAAQVANLMSYPYEIRKFLLRSMNWLRMCFQDILENTTDDDTELRLNVDWYSVMRSVFVLNDGKQFCKWKQERVLENRPFCNLRGRTSDIPEEIKEKSWKEVELPTSEEQMPKFVIGRMFLALKRELEADGFFVEFDFFKDHAPVISISAVGDESLRANSEIFGGHSTADMG